MISSFLFCVIFVGLVYHAHQRPLTTPAAVLFDLSATLEAKVPRSLPTPSRVLRSLGSFLSQGGAGYTQTTSTGSKTTAASAPSPMGAPDSESSQSSPSASWGDSGVGRASSALESVANALETPPIHVDHVADAVMVALNSASGVRGAVGVRRMRELIGWPESGGNCGSDSKPVGVGSRI